MTSEPTEAYVWVWLPGATEPVVAGVLEPVGDAVTFTYARSYLGRDDAIPLYEPELPLEVGPIVPRTGQIAGCIADAGPDAWGRRVVMARRAARGDAGRTDPGLLTFLLESGSDRIGALDFQASPDVYRPRVTEHATLTELAESAERVEAGARLAPDLAEALLHGSSVGGARPKALVRDANRQLIAKFSSTTDTYPVVKAELAAMELARRAGLGVAPVDLTHAHGKDVLLVERFDRPGDGTRRAMVSALTILGLTERDALFGASYAQLAHIVRQRFTDAPGTLRELFSRITFNILVGNNDDHPRNHAAFWDGEMLTLTPAYDICPQPRAGGETRQLMEIGDDGYRMSQLIGCVERSRTYHLEPHEAREIIDHQVEVVRGQWDAVADAARLTDVERASLWGRQLLNDYALYDY